MNLKHTIRKVLKEEKDYTNLITKLLDTIIVSQYEDVCKVEVIAPWNRETISGGKYNDYKVSVHFIGGYGTKNWPNTMALRDKEEKIMDEIWLAVYDTFGVNVDLFSKHVKNCEDTEMIKEETEMPLQLRRRIEFDEDVVINYLRKFAIWAFEPGKRMEVVISKACSNAAYELIESVSLDMDDKTFGVLEKKVTNYLKEKYGEYIAEYISKFYNESGDEEDTTYVFWKHGDRNGGNGFSEGFKTWNELLRRYGSWFPSLDWADIKETLDSMQDNKPLLIVKPDDKFNSMRYYFSLIKKKS